MFNRTKVYAELEQQRCLIEEQQIEIQRLRRRIQLQIQLTAVIQAEFDAIKTALHSRPPLTPQSPGHGNDNLVARHLEREALPSRGRR